MIFYNLFYLKKIEIHLFSSFNFSFNTKVNFIIYYINMNKLIIVFIWACSPFYF